MEETQSLHEIHNYYTQYNISLFSLSHLFLHLILMMSNNLVEADELFVDIDVLESLE